MGKPLHLGLALSRQLLLVKHRFRFQDYEWDHYPHLSAHTQIHTHTHTHTQACILALVGNQLRLTVSRFCKWRCTIVSRDCFYNIFPLLPLTPSRPRSSYITAYRSALSPDWSKMNSFIMALSQTHIANRQSSYLYRFLTIQVEYYPPPDCYTSFT